MVKPSSALWRASHTSLKAGLRSRSSGQPSEKLKSPMNMAADLVVSSLKSPSSPKMCTSCSSRNFVAPLPLSRWLVAMTRLRQSWGSTSGWRQGGLGVPRSASCSMSPAGLGRQAAGAAHGVAEPGSGSGRSCPPTTTPGTALSGMAQHCAVIRWRQSLPGKAHAVKDGRQCFLAKMTQPYCRLAPRLPCATVRPRGPSEATYASCTQRV